MPACHLLLLISRHDTFVFSRMCTRGIVGYAQEHGQHEQVSHLGMYSLLVRSTSFAHVGYIPFFGADKFLIFLYIYWYVSSFMF